MSEQARRRQFIKSFEGIDLEDIEDLINDYVRRNPSLEIVNTSHNYNHLKDKPYSALVTFNKIPDKY